MIILDCETYESTIESLVNIYNISKDEIEDFFGSFDLDFHFDENKSFEYPDRELRLEFEKTYNVKHKDINNICWFHLTRTLITENFKEGILPLSQVLEKIWDIFFTIFKDTEHYENLLDMKSSGVNDFQFNLKVESNIHSGPYAMLIRDVAFCAEEVQNHDYLSIPEIFEDICNGYKSVYGVNIQKMLEDSLQPKIVKFSTKENNYISYIESALYYAYLKYNGKKLSNQLAGFDGKNKVIKNNQIIKIDNIL